MSVLWALTGSLDSRLVNDGKVGNVAYDVVSTEGASSKNKGGAEVRLLGSINGKSFEIFRTRALSKSSRKSEVLFTCVISSNLSLYAEAKFFRQP